MNFEMKIFACRSDRVCYILEVDENKNVTIKKMDEIKATSINDLKEAIKSYVKMKIKEILKNKVEVKPTNSENSSLIIYDEGL